MLASSFGSKLRYISVLNRIVPQMPLLIVKRIFTFWIARSGTRFSNVLTIFSAKPTKVPWPEYIIYGIVK